MSTLIPKPWGFEIKLTEDNLPYTGKIAYTKTGHQWSLQYHDQKIETITLISGKAQMLLGPDQDHLQTIDMIPSQGITIHPSTIHRFVATTDCVTFEVSTPEVGTTFRLSDDYTRPDETETVRLDPSRGWRPK